jgi:hypothetical protein
MISNCTSTKAFKVLCAVCSGAIRDNRPKPSHRASFIWDKIRKLPFISREGAKIVKILGTHCQIPGSAIAISPFFLPSRDTFLPTQTPRSPFRILRLARQAKLRYLLPGFTAGMLTRSGGNLSGSNVSTFICTSETNGHPKSGSEPPLRSTIAPAAATIPPWLRTI